MKDKLIATITLGCIFSLFFYYKIADSNEGNIISNVNNIDSVEQFVEEVIKKENDMLKVNSSISDSDIIESVEDDVCNLDVNETNALDFSDAFKYFRNCNGSNSLFNWNNKAYSTLLKSEIKNNILLTEDEEVNEDNDSNVDKNHLQLQSQLIGDNLK